MSFLDKFREMLSQREIQEVSYSDLDSWIEKKLSIETKSMRKKGLKLAREIEMSFQELAEDVLNIERMKRKELVKKLSNIVKTSQKKFSESIINIVKRIKLKEEDYDSLLEFHQDVLDALLQIQKMDRMHGRYLYLAFEKDMKDVRKTLQQLAVFCEELGKTLSEKEKVSNLRELQDEHRNTLNIAKRIENLELEGRELRGRIEKLSRERKRLKERLKEFEKSKEHVELLKRLNDLKALKRELEVLEREVYEILHPLSRMFRKFFKLCESGRFKFNTFYLERYLSSECETFFLEEISYPRLKEILRGILKALESKILSEKPLKLKKFRELSDSLLSDFLIEKQKGYRSLKERISEYEGMDRGILERIEDLRREIKEKEREELRFSKKRKEILKEIKNKKAELKNLEESLTLRLERDFFVKLIEK